MENNVKKGAIRYFIILMVQKIIGIGIYFVSAGTIYDIRGNTNVILYFIISIIAGIIMLVKYQNTLNERGKKQDNTKSWDKILLPVYVLLAYFVIYLIAGFGIRFNWNKLPLECFYAGIILYVFSSIFIVMPIMVNKHFEETSRIQENRKQTVVQNGVYRIIRHPGYLGIILWAIACYLMFGTFVIGIVSLIIVIIIWIRTYLEDKMLKNELEGYIEYTEKVKYRLIPLIW